MFCQQCGNKVNDDSIFCDKCGLKVAAVEEQPEVQRKEEAIKPAPTKQSMSEYDRCMEGTQNARQQRFWPLLMARTSATIERPLDRESLINCIC